MNTLRGIVRPLACTAAAALFILCTSIAGAADAPSRYGGPLQRRAPPATSPPNSWRSAERPGTSRRARLNALVGQDTVTSEISQLKTQYGEPAMDQFLKTFDFAVNDGGTRRPRQLKFPRRQR